MSASILTQISTLTACLTGIASCTSMEEIKIVSVMENKVIHCNEQCAKRFSCQRYMTYKYSEWEYCYVMRGCIDFQLLKQVTK